LKYSTVWKMVGFSRRKSQKGLVKASGLRSRTAHSRHALSVSTCQLTWQTSLGDSLEMQLTQARLSRGGRPSMSAMTKCLEALKAGVAAKEAEAETEAEAEAEETWA
jgi:hypothetical protein